MNKLIKKSMEMPSAAKLLLAANLGALLFALLMQYGFDLHPCLLCLWQRVPYACAAAFSLLALIGKPCPRRIVGLLALCALVYLAGMGLAVFHTGVEQHWWLGTSGCAVEPLKGSAPDALRESLLQTVTPRCDQITWTILGLSMTNLNIVLSLVLAFFATAVAAKAAQDS